MSDDPSNQPAVQYRVVVAAGPLESLARRRQRVDGYRSLEQPRYTLPQNMATP